MEVKGPTGRNSNPREHSLPRNWVATHPFLYLTSDLFDLRS